MSLKAIAERVGTSVGTVSIVLNGRHSNVRISDATRAAILEAARELGYTPNIAARRLREGATGRITVALVWALDSRFPLIARVLRGVQQYFERQEEVQHELIIETFRPGQVRHLESLQSATRFHGAIIGNTTPDDDAYLEETPLPAPVVRFQRTSGRHSTVDHDGFQAGAAVVDYLVGLGHRRIGLINPAVASEAVHTRYEGFRARMRHFHLEWPEESDHFTEAGGYSAAKRLLERPDRPTALFALSDTMAMGALHAAKRLGLSVPRDVSVVGYDDIDASAFTDPPLTTVRVPIEDMAAGAARLLLAHLQRRLTGPERTLFRYQLVARDSCAPPP